MLKNIEIFKGIDDLQNIFPFSYKYLYWIYNRTCSILSEFAHSMNIMIKNIEKYILYILQTLKHKNSIYHTNTFSYLKKKFPI